jgi:hypothetical protein
MAYTDTKTFTILDNTAGAVFIAGALLTQPLLKDWMYHWGATPEERRMRLPGDELVPQPKITTTRAVTIHAPVEKVWPWLAQIGQVRGGLYSYELLENIARCDMHNANEINPDWQPWKVGDTLRLGPKGYPLFKLAAVEPGHTLVFAGADPKTETVPEWHDPMPPAYVLSSWAMTLKPSEAGTSRLMMREQLDYGPASFANWLLWEALSYTIGFVMMRRMLLGIKARAEASR